MSYSLFCNFYVNNKFKLKICFDELKNINQTRYSSDLLCKPCNADIEIPEYVSGSSAKFYDMNSFVNLRDTLQKNFEDAYKRKMEAIFQKKSLSYIYQFDSFKENLASIVDECEEVMNNCLYGISTCDKMIGFISVFENEQYSLKEDEETDYKKNDVKVLIWAE